MTVANLVPRCDMCIAGDCLRVVLPLTALSLSMLTCAVPMCAKQILQWVQ